jgi:hypothetical protein
MWTSGAVGRTDPGEYVELARFLAVLVESPKTDRLSSSNALERWISRSSDTQYQLPAPWLQLAFAFFATPRRTISPTATRRRSEIIALPTPASSGPHRRLTIPCSTSS